VAASLPASRGACRLSGFELRLTYVGGPTALLELGGLRLLTDPTFDPAGSEYPGAGYVLRKTQGPALSPETVGKVDAVLLSHDHHADNLDRAGRASLGNASVVLTTRDGAGRLGANAAGLLPGQSHALQAANGRTLRVTATPARHGPPGGDRGPVIGFALAFGHDPDRVIYIFGDTVWYDAISELAPGMSPTVAILFMGAARVREVGPANLTFTADEAVIAARAFPRASVVPLHFEGWEHYSESHQDIERAFAAAGLADRLLVPTQGKSLLLS